VHDEGRVLIEHAGTLVTLDGAAVTTLLPRLLPLLDGSRTTDELVVALGPAVAPAVENALMLLAENRLLVDGPYPDADGHASSSGAYAAALTRSTTPSAAAAALETARVSVLGSGACAAELARQLATAGVGLVEQLCLDAEPPHGSFVTAVPSPPRRTHSGASTSGRSGAATRGCRSSRTTAGSSSRARSSCPAPPGAERASRRGVPRPRASRMTSTWWTGSRSGRRALAPSSRWPPRWRRCWSFAG